MENTYESISYLEEEYQGWKTARKPSEDDSKQAYVKWRIERDKKASEASLELEKRFEESDERVKNMTPEEREALQQARKRHALKVRIEMQGYDKHTDEKN